MTTECRHIEVSGIPVEVRRKAIINLHIRVYPPNGAVHVSAPVHLDDESVRLAIVSRLSWIHRQQRRFLRQTREPAREMVTGESHYYSGIRYRLDVVERPGHPGVRVVDKSTLQLQVRPGADRLDREKVLERWYRQQLKTHIPGLIARWAPVMGVEVNECRIKRMRTLWGSCNIPAKRVWLNLELAKKPLRCLEYVLVHEMVHLLERHHNARFRGFMDQFMPDWRLRSDELNGMPQ